MEDILRISDPSCLATPPPFQLMEETASLNSSNSFEKISCLVFFFYFIGHEKNPASPQGIKAQCFNYIMPINANKFYAKDLCCTSAK